MWVILFNFLVFEPTCANCTVGSYASLSVCPWLDKNYWTIIHISESVMKLDQNMDVDDPKVDLKGQGRQVKKMWICDFISHLTILHVMLEVKGHMGQGQRSHGSGSKVTWVKPSLKVMILAGGLTSTSSCIFWLGVSSSWPLISIPFLNRLQRQRNREWSPPSIRCGELGCDLGYSYNVLSLTFCWFFSTLFIICPQWLSPCTGENDPKCSSMQAQRT